MKQILSQVKSIAHQPTDQLTNYQEEKLSIKKMFLNLQQQFLNFGSEEYSSLSKLKFGIAKYRASTTTCTMLIQTLILLLITSTNHLIKNAQGLQQINPLQPVFIKNMDRVTVKENTPVGQIIYTLEAQIDRDIQRQGQIIYGIEGTNLFKVDKFTGQVSVAQPIDREKTSDSIEFQVSATIAYNSNLLPSQIQRFQSYGPVTQLLITVDILDENDNPPKIKQVKIGQKAINNLASGFNPPIVPLSINESLPIDSVIVDLIETIDVDKASSDPLRAMCLNCEPEFELKTTSDNLVNDRLDLSIVLVNKLIHVPRNNIRQLNVIITDGKFNSSILFEITIGDVQDKPPQFNGPTTCVVNENVQIDRTIMVLQAIDGDAVSIDESGVVTMPKFDETYQNGREILYDFINHEGKSTSVLGDFKLHPLTGELQVANRLDRESYLSSNGILNLKVRARELLIQSDNTDAKQDDLYESMLEKLNPFVDQSPLATSETDLTVILADINDNEPHWLNSSEILALGLNESPDWYNNLPSDHETGRIYQFKVNENSLVGSPITMKNEIFVYDLDSGINSNFNISLVDPFNLFDVEPKQVSGFAAITLKLANHNNHNHKQASGGSQSVLDYENLNGKSFIIQLIATETSTNERFSSKAQVQINVIDVNDNVPEFKETAYIANVREDSPPGKGVVQVQAIDKDEISKQLTYSLHGRSAHLFDINRQTGLITVAKCIQPTTSSPTSTATATATTTTTSRLRQSQSSSNNQQRNNNNNKQCIDYEQQKSHSLLVEVSDGELSSRVPLMVFISDANDNPPTFSLPIIDAVVEEGADKLDFPIKVEATDLDKTSVITYSIIEGNFEGLFNINNATGELQLSRPIKIPHEDSMLLMSPPPSSPGLTSASGGGGGGGGGRIDYRQQQLNKMTLVVQANDGIFTTNVTIRIDILDSNDNPPKFIRPQYYAEISELSLSGQFVTTVRAIDSDRGNNARVSYKIVRGSYGQFEIDESNGVISVANQAQPFDSTKRENYTIEVLAYDHGLISKSSSVLVNVHILDTIKRSSKFEPKIQRITVNESTPINTIIHRMNIGPISEQNNELMILTFEIGLIEALDKNGHPILADGGGIERERLDTMFSISNDTGDIMVNSMLDYDFVSNINLTIYLTARQSSSSPSLSPMLAEPTIEEFIPRSIGYLIIKIMDNNENAPIFASPWTQQNPELYYKMLEEMPVNSILTQFMATDYDSKISHFEIEPPNEFFELTSPQTGVVVNKRLIDYDAIMSNNNNNNNNNQRKNIITFNVFAYDSGTPQLFAKAIVNVEILPVNDWDCKFEQSIYEVKLKENSLTDTLVIQVRANDFDSGEQHNTISYQLFGDYSEFFHINSRTGLVTVSNKSLDSEQLISPFLLTVIGRDDGLQQQQQQQQQNEVRTCSTTIKVYLEDINDNPPVFSQKIYEVTAFDTDIVEVPLIKLIVHDNDVVNQSKGTSAPLTTFRIISGNINDSFNITNSGVIYAIKPLNESLSLSSNVPLQLRVQAKQQSANLTPGVITSFTDECLVRINFVKINRYGPEWRFDNLKGVSVRENSMPGTFVTQLKCIDRDLEVRQRSSTNRIIELFDSSSNSNNNNNNNEENIYNSTTKSSPIRYWIKDNNLNVLETNEFKLDPISGNLVTKVKLDRELREYYELIVSCEDNGKPQSLDSMTSIFITVLDVDDNEPEFLVHQAADSSSVVLVNQVTKSSSNDIVVRKIQRPTISFTIEEHQSTGLPIGELKAIDRDIKGTYPISYCLIEGNEFREFSLDTITGILYTNQTLDRERQSTYELLVKAINDGSNCNDHMIIGTSLTQPQTNNNNQKRNSTTTKSTVSLLQNSKTTKRSPIDTSGDDDETLLSSESSIDRQQQQQQQQQQFNHSNYLLVKIDILDINDNAPIFKRTVYKAGVHHKALMNSLVTKVVAFDPDFGLNGTLNYKISETLMYKTTGTTTHSNHHHHQQSKNFSLPPSEPSSKPIKLVQSPFRIDKSGNIYTNQLLTQYPLLSMFILQIEASEQVEPWRTAKTKLEVYIYDTSNQLNIRMNIHPRLIEYYSDELETLFSNATKYTAIINRARDYQDTSQTVESTINRSSSIQAPRGVQTLQQTNKQQTIQQVPTSSSSSLNQDESPIFSNIHLIFVENFKIVNPNLVMEKFDLTSAQLFMPQILTQSSANNNPKDSSNAKNFQIDNQQVSSLIDKIALASVQQAEFHVSASSIVGIDWLESAPIIYLTLTSLLVLIGFVLVFMTCCCNSKLKDQIAKKAMNSLTKQQALQAKLREQMLASTNQMANLGSYLDGQDYILDHQGTYMSSFDATKGCIMNNNENAHILQRAMESGEFIDPNYTTLNGRINLGAHHYDVSEIEQCEAIANGEEIGNNKQLTNSNSDSIHTDMA